MKQFFSWKKCAVINIGWCEKAIACGINVDILYRCSFIHGKDGKLESFSKSMQDRLVREVIEPMACNGLRTISIAYRDFVRGKAEINQVKYIINFLLNLKW